MYLLVPIAVELFFLSGRIDRLWRKAHRLYIEDKIPDEKLLSLDDTWEKLFDNFNDYLEEVSQKIRAWDSIEAKETIPYFVLPYSERKQIYSRLQKELKTRGVPYLPQANTEIGMNFFKLAKTLNNVLFVLEKYCNRNTHSLALKMAVYDKAVEHINQLRLHEGYGRKYIQSLNEDKKLSKKRKKERKEK